MYDFNKAKEAMDARKETMDKLKCAKAAFKAAKITYKEAREGAACAMVEMIGNTPGEHMTTTQLRNQTGLDAKTIRSLLAPENAAYYDTRAITKGCTTIAVIERHHVSECRKFVLIDDDGQIHPETTTTQRVRVNDYRIRSRHV